LLQAGDIMGKQLFRNGLFNEFFNKNGFLLCDYDQGEVAEELRVIYERHCTQQITEETQFYYSLMNTASFNMAVKKEIASVLSDVYDTFFNDCSIFSESIMVKKSFDHSELFLHQDWNYVNEKDSITATLWLPLQSVNEQNGAFFFIKGSHLWFDNLRSPTIPSIRVQALPQYAHLLETVNVQKGQILFFHPALWHGSHPNQSAEHRAIVAAIVKPKKDPLLHYHQKNGWVRSFEITEDLFLEELPHLSIGDAPKVYKNRSLIFFPRLLTEDAVKNKLLWHVKKTDF
jgi:Phytanoyl-CoA dioxygenase (PhyH)